MTIARIDVRANGAVRGSALSAFIVIALSALALVAFSESRPSAQVACQQSLEPAGGAALGYMLRGDRCEGMYTLKVASSGLLLASMTGTPRRPGATASPCDARQPFLLTWTRPSGPGLERIRLTVESLRPGLNYRLDTTRPSTSTSYIWPADPRCGNVVRLAREEMAVLAQTRTTIDGQPADVLLPVAVGGDEGPVEPPYQLTMLPGERVSRMFTSLWRVRQGAAATPLISERQSGRSGLAPIVVTLTARDVEGAGIYRVRLAVEFESGAAQAVEAFFAHG